MSNFVIFEDQENFKQKSTPTLAEGKRDRPKLVPLPNKENAIKNQVRNLFAASRLCLLKFFFFPSGLEVCEAVRNISSC